MINVNELKPKVKKVFAPGKEKELLDYLIAVIREDVIKIINDIVQIARSSFTTDNLYNMYINTILTESSENIEEIIGLFNSLSTTVKLDTIEIDIMPIDHVTEQWDGPIVTPVFKE